MPQLSTRIRPATYLHLAKMTGAAGMENHLLDLLPGLRSLGCRVSLCILVEPDKPMREYTAHLRSLGVPTETIPIQRDFDLGLIGHLTDKLRSYDAVHTHLIHADLHGGIAARRSGIRYVFCTAHNDDKFRRLWPVRMLQAWLWRRIDAGFAISEALRQFVIKTEFAPAARVHTVHYGFDPVQMPSQSELRLKMRKELGLAAETPIAGSVCRLTEQKGITYAIAAFRQVITQVTNAHYLIVGDGPLRDVLQLEAQAAGVQGRVHFVGWRSDARSLFAAFDVLLMPSLWEGFGLVALEAMAAGIPVIAARSGSLPEIVADGETGFIVPAADPAALAAAIKRIFGDPTQAQAMGSRGRRRLESVFSPAKMIEGTLKVYGSV